MTSFAVRSPPRRAHHLARRSHTLHQHDAPDCDFSAERILKEAGLDARQYEGRFQRQIMADLAPPSAKVPRAERRSVHDV